MPTRPRLTTADEVAARARARASASPREEAPRSERRERTEEERARHKERIAAVKDALKRSATLKGEHVAAARSALRDWLRQPGDTSDDRFAILVEAPFREPPKKRERR